MLDSGKIILRHRAKWRVVVHWLACHFVVFVRILVSDLKVFSCCFYYRYTFPKCTNCTVHPNGYKFYCLLLELDTRAVDSCNLVGTTHLVSSLTVLYWLSWAHLLFCSELFDIFVVCCQSNEARITFYYCLQLQFTILKFASRQTCPCFAKHARFVNSIVTMFSCLCLLWPPKPLARWFAFACKFDLIACSKCGTRCVVPSAVISFFIFFYFLIGECFLGK